MMPLGMGSILGSPLLGPGGERGAPRGAGADAPIKSWVTSLCRMHCYTNKVPPPWRAVAASLPCCRPFKEMVQLMAGWEPAAAPAPAGPPGRMLYFPGVFFFYPLS